MGSEIVTIDIDGFKNAVGKFPTGICIITTELNGDIHGFTANSFVSVSLEPALVSFCLDKKAFSLSKFSKSNHFVVNILSDQQADLATKFAKSGIDKFTNVSYSLNEHQIPKIENSISILECKKYNQIECGDHVIFIGEVEKLETDSGLQPLVYYGKNYRKIS